MRAFQTVCLSLAIGLVSVTASSAQFANPQVALAGRAGAMTCGEFSHLSPKHRDAIIRGLNISAPPQTLASPVFTPHVGSRPGSHHRVVVGVGPTNPGSPLTAGVLVSACQGVTAGESLRSAYSEFNSGRGAVVHRR